MRTSARVVGMVAVVILWGLSRVYCDPVVPGPAALDPKGTEKQRGGAEQPSSERGAPEERPHEGVTEGRMGGVSPQERLDAEKAELEAEAAGAQRAAESKAAPSEPREKGGRLPLLWCGGVLAGAAFLALIAVYALVRYDRKERAELDGG